MSSLFKKKETPAIAENRTPWMDFVLPKIGWTETKNDKELSKYWKYTNCKNFKTCIGAEHAWCAMFVCAALEETGFKGTSDAGADSFLHYGEKKITCVYGCILVLKTGNTGSGYHVTFFSHYDKNGNLVCVGGNQDNSVCYKTYARDQVSGIRWPVKK